MTMGPAGTAPPDPRAFSTLRDWIIAALAWKGVSARHASLGAGFGPNVVGRIRKEGTASRPVLDRLAEYFSVDRAELRALRPKSQAHIAAGKAVAARIGPDRMRQITALARARQSDEDRRRTAQPEVATAALRRARRQDPVRFAESDRRRAAPRRKGLALLCVFCGEGEPIYRSKSQLERGYAHYHRECYARFRRTDAQREYSQALGTVGWIWSRVKPSEDEALKQRVWAQIEAQLMFLRQPVRKGRPPTLLRDRKLAVEAASLHDDSGKSARQIALILGFKLTTDQRGREAHARHIWRLIQLGRTLRLGVVSGVVAPQE